MTNPLYLYLTPIAELTNSDLRGLIQFFERQGWGLHCLEVL